MMNLSACKIKEEYFDPKLLPAAEEVAKFIDENTTENMRVVTVGAMMSFSDFIRNHPDATLVEIMYDLSNVINLSIGLGFVEGQRTARLEQEEILMGMNPGDDN